MSRNSNENRSRRRQAVSKADLEKRILRAALTGEYDVPGGVTVNEVIETVAPARQHDYYICYWRRMVINAQRFLERELVLNYGWEKVTTPPEQNNRWMSPAARAHAGTLPPRSPRMSAEHLEAKVCSWLFSDGLDRRSGFTAREVMDRAIRNLWRFSEEDLRGMTSDVESFLRECSREPNWNAWEHKGERYFSLPRTAVLGVEPLRLPGRLVVA